MTRRRQTLTCTGDDDDGGATVYESSAAERTRSLLLQVALVGMVVFGALTVFDAVSSATEPAANSMDAGIHQAP
jgi:hypothetical protein